MNRKRFDIDMVDVMDGDARWEIPIHQHGSVSLVDVMPRLIPAGKSADGAIVQAARVSYGHGTETHSKDEALIRILMRHWHTTPFEMVEFKFHCVMPIFVARQWIRHRTANVNEYSARYSLVQDRFYHPEPSTLKLQSETNKQGTSDELVSPSDALWFLSELEHQEAEAFKIYEAAAKKGIARETARMVLPVNTYTEWYWKIDLHNLFNFLRLRMDSHAQQEIQDYANAMFELVKHIVPLSCKAFEDFRLNAVTLSGPEIEAIQAGVHELTCRGDITFPTVREKAEFLEKLNKLEL